MLEGHPSRKAFYNAKLHISQHPYTCFAFNGHVFSHRTCAFGVSTSPANWMQIISTVFFIARKQYPVLFRNASVYSEWQLQ